MTSLKPSSAPHARAHRMLFYLLMAMVILTLADVSAYYTVVVFILYLWSDNGTVVARLSAEGRSSAWIAGRTFLDVLPLIIAVCLVWQLTPQPVVSGVLLLAALGFYLISRHRLASAKTPTA